MTFPMGGNESSHNIKTFARFRPLNTAEKVKKIK